MPCGWATETGVVRLLDCGASRMLGRPGHGDAVFVVPTNNNLGFMRQSSITSLYVCVWECLSNRYLSVLAWLHLIDDIPDRVNSGLDARP